VAGQAVEQWEVGDDPMVAPDAEVVATAPQRSDRRALRHERWVRWVFTGALALFLLLAALGLFGVRTATRSASGGGYDLEVRYAAVTRPGLATPFEIEIGFGGGVPPSGTVRVAVSSPYLAMFDENSLDPDPEAATRTEDATIWELEAPRTGEPLVISLDARLEPAVQWGRDGYVQVLDDDTPVVEVRFETWVMP
jgi:hypothetical protein